MNLITEENARPGTGRWWELRHAPPGAIEAYTTQPSARAGERIALCVSTRPAARYRVTVYRLGWYGGDGGRQIARTPPNVGLARDAPPMDRETGHCRAGWPVIESLLVSHMWVPGCYVAQLELLTGPHAGQGALVPFVVPRARSDAPAVLVQTGVNTVQAYNHWGGKSLYQSNSTEGVQAVKVSFDRPVPAWRQANLNARAPFHYDLPLIRWLEREGLDVGYQTDVDTHRDPWTLTGPRALVCAAHDEYWTCEMRGAFDAAQRAGTHMAFLGANQCYWQARYEDAERTLVVYRDAGRDPEPDPGRKTVLWRDLGKPESHLIGVQYQGGQTSPSALLDYAVAAGAASGRWSAGAGFEDTASVPATVGYEWDTLDPGFEPPQMRRFLHCSDERSDADCVGWRAESGSLVLAAGSLGLTHALDDWAQPGRADARVQSLVRNALAQMLE